MRSKMLFIIGVLLFVLGQIGVNFLIYKYKNNNEDIPKVILRDVENNKKDKKSSFAIMLEQDDGSYKTTSSNSFNQPGYTFNSEKSGCIDISGNKIADSLNYNYDTKSVVVSVSGTAYCYAYFDQIPNLYKVCGSNNMTECEKIGKLSTVEGMWQSGLEGDGYRYIGTNPDNYICFGTTDKEACTENTDAYMYRIIGVFADSSGTKYMKLIKKESLAANEWSGYAWNDNNNDIDWGSSTLKSNLNGSLFLTNNTYMPVDGSKSWKDRIKEWTWNTVNTQGYSNGLHYYYNTGKNVYLHEMKKGVGASDCKQISNESVICTTGLWSTATGKIGLMYASDYLLALGSDALNYTSNSNASNLKTSWMYLWNANNDLSAPHSYYEWTISRCGNYSRSNHVWYVGSGGYVSVSSGSAISPYSVRPVFYLESTQVIKSGSGTLSDPFILSD